ncbi:MAG: hypothetical protein WAN14_21605 [Candidatus Acidiferrales bacterium]
MGRSHPCATFEQLDRVIPELRQALHDHCEGIREKLSKHPPIARRLALQIDDLLLDEDADAHCGPNQPPSPNSKKK